MQSFLLKVPGGEEGWTMPLWTNKSVNDQKSLPSLVSHETFWDWFRSRIIIIVVLNLINVYNNGQNNALLYYSISYFYASSIVTSMLLMVIQSYRYWIRCFLGFIIVVISSSVRTGGNYYVIEPKAYQPPVKKSWLSRNTGWSGIDGTRLNSINSVLDLTKFWKLCKVIVT